MATINSSFNQPTVNTYTPISLTNPSSSIMPSRLTISYFNKLMCLTITPKTGYDSNGIPVFDIRSSNNNVRVYISYNQAKILYTLAKDLFYNPNTAYKNNIALELKNNILKISDGKEFNSDSPCVSITYKDSSNTNQEIIYQTKTSYMGMTNFSNGQFDKQTFPNMEIDALLMTFEQYYLSSSYAIAASIRQANMYDVAVTNNINNNKFAKNNSAFNLTERTAEESFYNNSSFLSNNNDINTEDFSSESFDSLVNNLNGDGNIGDNNTGINNKKK